MYVDVQHVSQRHTWEIIWMTMCIFLPRLFETNRIKCAQRTPENNRRSLCAVEMVGRFLTSFLTNTQKECDGSDGQMIECLLVRCALVSFQKFTCDSSLQTAKERFTTQQRAHSTSSVAEVWMWPTSCHENVSLRRTEFYAYLMFFFKLILFRFVTDGEWFRCVRGNTGHPGVDCGFCTVPRASL